MSEQQEDTAPPKDYPWPATVAEFDARQRTHLEQLDSMVRDLFARSLTAAEQQTGLPASSIYANLVKALVAHAEANKPTEQADASEQDLETATELLHGAVHALDAVACRGDLLASTQLRGALKAFKKPAEDPKLQLLLMLEEAANYYYAEINLRVPDSNGALERIAAPPWLADREKLRTDIVDAAVRYLPTLDANFASVTAQEVRALLDMLTPERPNTGSTSRGLIYAATALAMKFEAFPVRGPKLDASERAFDAEWNWLTQDTRDAMEIVERTFKNQARKYPNRFKRTSVLQGIMPPLPPVPANGTV